MPAVRSYASGGGQFGTATVTIPAGTLAGDTLLLCLTGPGSPQSASGGATLNGWSPVDLYVSWSAASTDFGGGVWIATATASSAGSVVTATNAGAAALSLVVLSTTPASITRIQRVQNPAPVGTQALALTGPYSASSVMVTLGGAGSTGTFSVSAGTVVGQASGPGNASGSTFVAEAEPGAAGSDYGLTVTRSSTTGGQYYLLAQIDTAPSGSATAVTLNPEQFLTASPLGARAGFLVKGRPTKFDDSLAGG